LSNIKLIGQGVRGLRLPKIWGFPLTLNVALTTVLRTNVLHCDFHSNISALSSLSRALQHSVIWIYLVAFVVILICLVLQQDEIFLQLKINKKKYPNKLLYIGIKVWQTRNHNVA